MAIYGIDLGTTYCAVARMDPTRSREPIPVLFDGGGAFPSLVLLAPGVRGPRAVVGSRARQEYARLVGGRADPPPGVHLIRGAKNHIGRTPDGEPGDPPWVVGGVEFSATDVSALILCALRKRVAQQGLPPMQRAVVTHPQKFRNLQRLATQQAAQLAGLDVLGMLTEPDAAAWAYEFDHPSPENLRTVVFDFGGGTLDVVLMSSARDAAGRLQTSVVASEGASCGGLEIDQRICEALVDRYGRAVGSPVELDALNALARDDFMVNAEHVKRALNTRDAAHDQDWRENVMTLTFHPLLDHPKVSFDVTLGELSDWIRPVLDRAMATLRRALERGSWRESDVQLIRMTGQSSLLVAMQRLLQDRFGRDRVQVEPDIHSFLHPATIVAAGASIFGERIETPHAHADLVMGATPEPIYFTSRLSPKDVAAEVFEGIPARERTPAVKGKTYRLTIAGKALPNGGRTLPIEVFEGEVRTPIGSYPITFDRPLRDGDEIEIVHEFAHNGRYAMKVRYGDELREVQVAEVDCILDQQAMKARRAVIESVELEV